MDDNVQSFYAEFAKNLSQNELFELILAANFLGISSLLQLMCATVCSLLKGKKPLEMREILGNVKE